MQTYTKKNVLTTALAILAAIIIVAQALFITTTLHRLETALNPKVTKGIILVGECPGGNSHC